MQQHEGSNTQVKKPWGLMLSGVEEALLTQDIQYKVVKSSSTMQNIRIPKRGQFLRFSKNVDEGVTSNAYKRQYTATLLKARMLREIHLLSNLDHPNILALLDSPPWLSSLGGVVCITTLYEINLGQYCDSRFASGVPSRAAIEILTTVFYAIEYLHENGVCHRRICPSKILVGPPVVQQVLKHPGRGVDSSPWSHLKISGLKDGCHFADKDMMGVVGERRYSAPEMLRRNFYSEKVDVWSSACSVAAFVLPLADRARTDDKFRERLTLLYSDKQPRPSRSKRAPVAEDEGRVKSSPVEDRFLRTVLAYALRPCPRNRRSAERVRATLTSGNLATLEESQNKIVPSVEIVEEAESKDISESLNNHKKIETEWIFFVSKKLLAMRRSVTVDDVLEAAHCDMEKREFLKNMFKNLEAACLRLNISVTSQMAAAHFLTLDVTAAVQFPQKRQRRDVCS